MRQQPQQHLEKPQQHAGLVSTYSPPLQAADVPVYPGMYAPASPSYPYAQTSPYPQEPAPAPLFAGASPYGSYPPLGSPQYMGGASSVTPPPMPSATLTPPMPPVSNFPEADGSFAAADSFASPYGYFGGIGIGIHNPYDGLNVCSTTACLA